MDIHYFWQVFHTAPNDLFCPIAKKYCKQEGVYLSRTEHVVTIFCKSMIVVILPFVWLFADTTAQVRLIVENWLPSLLRGLWSCLCNLSVILEWNRLKVIIIGMEYSSGFQVVPCYWVKQNCGIFCHDLQWRSCQKLYSRWVMTVLLSVTLRLLHSTQGAAEVPRTLFFLQKDTWVPVLGTITKVTFPRIWGHVKIF